jgi:hypothetical protein
MTRGEAWIRLGFAVVALALIIAILIVQGLPEGPGLVEVLGVGLLFAGWSGVRATLWLWRNGR